MTSASFDYILDSFIASLKKDVDEEVIKHPGSMPTKTLHLNVVAIGDVNISIYFSRVVQMYGALRQGEDILDTHDVDIVCVVTCPGKNVCVSRSTRPVDLWQRWPEMTKALIQHTMSIFDKEQAAGHI